MECCAFWQSWCIFLLSLFYKAKVKQTQNIFSYSSSADILRIEWFKMFYFVSFALYFYELFPVRVPIWKQKNHYKNENKMVCITCLTCFVLCLQALKTASHIFSLSLKITYISLIYSRSWQTDHIWSTGCCIFKTNFTVFSVFQSGKILSGCLWKVNADHCIYPFVLMTISFCAFKF